MNKMNKKGFTLIEMLVVIAIIAVLVAIIIPTVSSSTIKAKSAADAANLRSVLAEATAEKVAGVENTDGFIHCTSDGAISIAKAGDPECKTNSNWKIAVTDTAVPEVTFGTHTIAEFAAAAESGVAVTD